MIDQRPELIVRCRGAADIITAVNFAREHGAALLDDRRAPPVV
jgi:hypothetical protein